MWDRNTCYLPSDNCEECDDDAHLLELHSWAIRSQQEEYTLFHAAATRIVGHSSNRLLI